MHQAAYWNALSVLNWKNYMYNDKCIIAVVTARAGSQGLPNKNYKQLDGYPLFWYSLFTANSSKHVDYIYVSSNCKEVKRLSEKYMIRFNKTHHCKEKIKPLIFIDRPDELSTSTSKNEEALIHAVNYHEENKENPPVGMVVNLQPTSPIRHVEGKNFIDNAIEEMVESGCRTLMTVSEHTPFFVQRNEDGSLNWHYDILNRPMRQELKPSEIYYHDDGCLYITDREVLLETRCRLDENAYLYVNDKYNSLQIDTKQDFDLLELVFENMFDNM